MEYVRLGASGLKVSRLCVGCMSFGTAMDWMRPEEESRVIIRRAIEAGLNFFDTANFYSYGESEEILGRALTDFGLARDEAVIATKVFFPMGQGPNDRGLSRKHILSALDDSLRRLGTDYVDLLQIHRFDVDTPIEETLQALDTVVRAGKVRYIGASTMAAWQFSKMLHLSDQRGLAKFVSMQNNYSLVYREEEREMIPLCLDQGVGLIPYSPLGGGLLAGNRKANTVRANSLLARTQYKRAADQEVVDLTAQVAERRGVSPAQVALAWLLSRPGVAAPIVGVTKAAQLDDLLPAIELKLSAEELAALGDVYQPQAPFPAVPLGLPPPPARKRV